MQITTTARGEGADVKLKGRMDAGWSDHVCRALEQCLQSGQHALTLDMAEVDYLSSAGIRVLVLYAKKLKLIQGSFAIINASSQVRRVLELSGLQSLLFRATDSATGPVTPARSAAVALAEPGAIAESFDLELQAGLCVEWPGHPESWLGSGALETLVPMEFPADAIGIGLGGFGSDATGGGACPGEFLAAAGAVVCLPADGSHHPDYMLQEEALTPSLSVAYGIVGRGSFRRLLRFDKGPRPTGLPLSTVVKACLQAGDGKPAGLVMVAETASLTGASLQKMPSDSGPSGRARSLFDFPAVRDRLSFTAEPAFANTTSLIVGFAADRTQADGLRLLKPIVPSGELVGHFHAAVFPYQPLRKGKVDLGQTVRPLFENGQVLGLLHLLNDWREINGVGESQFLRGACWCSPLLVRSEQLMRPQLDSLSNKSIA